MAKIVARNARILLSGHDVSCDTNNCVLSRSAESPEVTSFCDNNRTRLAAGIKDFEITVDGFVNMGASRTDALYAELLNQRVLGSFFPEGWAASNTAHGFVGVISNYEQTYATEDAAATSITITASGIYTRGKSLGYFSRVVAASTTGCTMDNDAYTANGYLFLHVLELQNGATVSASLLHSNNDITYTTAGVINPITASGQSGSVALSASRYIQLKYGITGGSATIAGMYGSWI